MWPNDEPLNIDIEDQIRAANRVPRLSVGFRSRVMDEALRVRQRTLSLHRIQTLTTSFLAASLLLFLPGYYHSLQNPASWASPTAVSSTWTAPPITMPGVSTADAFEWGLVQAELADRTASARIIRGAL